MSTLEQPYRSANRPVQRKPVPKPATPSASSSITTKRTSSSTFLSDNTASTSPPHFYQPSTNQPSRFGASKQSVPAVQCLEQSYSSQVQASRNPTSPTHSHTRTASSGVLPASNAPSQPQPQPQQQQPQSPPNMNAASYQPYINHPPGNPIHTPYPLQCHNLYCLHDGANPKVFQLLQFTKIYLFEIRQRPFELCRSNAETKGHCVVRQGSSMLAAHF